MYYGESNTNMDKTEIKVVAPPLLIINDDKVLRSPPTNSRLPPDGHEFPTNFSELIITPVKPDNSKITKSNNGSNSNTSNNSNEDPSLQKLVSPPIVPRKVYHQNFIIKAESARPPVKIETFIRQDQKISCTIPSAINTDESPRLKSSINTLHNLDSFQVRPTPVVRKLSDWRKDEKSEKSVRDKIAMFSNENGSRTELNNLLDSSSKFRTFSSGALTKKALSVENLNNDYRLYSRTNSGFIEQNKTENTLYKSEITQSYSSLPRRNISTLARTTSFSGHDEGSRRASIANILEQRRKSMSKLRGLVIPERPSSNLETIIDLPEIKSKDSEKIKMKDLGSLQSNSDSSKILNPFCFNSASKTPTHSNRVYKSTSSPTTRPLILTPITLGTEKSEGIVFPPTKPPRTPLMLSKNANVDESDNDPIFTSKIFSPLISPRAHIQEKFVLNSTLSLERNTSTDSSTPSTFTSGSGSQASCSSVGSAPTVYACRKIFESGSVDSSLNRKNILASSKCRSGRDDSSLLARNRRCEDEDSTDGYDEEDRRRVPKLKPRILSTVSNKSPVTLGTINYNLRVIPKGESIGDNTVKVISYVEINSDTDDSSSISDSSLRKISAIFIDEERKASFKKEPGQKACTTIPEAAKRSVPIVESDDLAKWIQSEAKLFRQKDQSFSKSVATQHSTIVAGKVKPLHKSKNERLTRAQIKSNTIRPEIREKFEMRDFSDQINDSSGKTSKFIKPGRVNSHIIDDDERFSSLDSIASSSSGVSSSTQTLTLLSKQDTAAEFDNFSSFNSNQNIITPEDIQVLIEEADPPLKTPDAFFVVLRRESPDSSIGITLAGGSDYEAKQITIHKILGNSPAAKYGRLKKGDRILAINGLSMRGLTHRESITVLKTPRPEVVLVVTRSESVIGKSLLKKRSSLGSLSSLNDKSTEIDANRKFSFHKASRSLDLDMDTVLTKESNESNSAFFRGSSKVDRLEHEFNINGNISPVETLSQQQIINHQTIQRGGIDGASVTHDVPIGAREVEIIKDHCGLGFSIDGGYDSPMGDRPLVVKKVFWGGAAQKAGNIKSGDEIICINDVIISRMTRVDVWNYMKQLPMGPVKIILM